MTGAEIALLVSGLMSGAGSLFGGGQERQSFGAGKVNDLMDRAADSSDDIMGLAQGLLGQDVNVTQAPGPGSLPTFAGGGMPMPIGVLGGAGGAAGGGLPGLKAPTRLRSAPSGPPQAPDGKIPGEEKPGTVAVRRRGRPGGGGPMGHGAGAPDNYRLPGIDQLGMQNQSGWGTALSPEELMAMVHMSGKKGGR